ncbi:MAG: DSD1 family PLP-dependent enzyme [Candidatus Hydrogenedens sp.]|nr:DSD1 family PLP-dependent enzyme [Candidatus Hydrogenedens sp.]
MKLPISLADLPTPALLLDEAAFERNLRKMADYLAGRGIGLRPHAKTHKSADIARKQLDAGAIGICCAKVSEAEALAAQGIGPILVTSPLSTPDKAARFAALALHQPDAMVVVDSLHGLDLLAAAATELGITIKLLIDLDVGTERTGIECGAPAVALAEQAAARTHLQVCGVQAYAGHLMHIDGFEARKRHSLAAMAEAAATRAAIEAGGIPCPVFTGGGTGTFDIDSDATGMTDLQCGSYLFMDQQYRIIGGPNGDTLDAFEPALYVWSSALTHPKPGRVTLDAGFKALPWDWVRPVLPDYPGTTYDWGGDEHGFAEYTADTPPIALGEKVKIFIAHCDPTVNLFDRYYLLRDGQIVDTWPVTARGCSQ